MFLFQSLGAGSLSFRAAPERAVGVEAEAEESQTTIELIGRDRPGLLSEVFAVLTDLRCNIVASEVWTHDARVAALVRVTDADAGGAVEDPARLDTVKRLLRHVLRGSSRDGNKKAARAAVSAAGAEHAQRRLHQMMHADRRGGARRGESDGGEASDDDGDGAASRGGSGRPVVEVVDCAERGYTLVNVRCRDRPKLLFDTVCTLTDMQYVVFHGTVIAEGSEAYQVLCLFASAASVLGISLISSSSHHETVCTSRRAGTCIGSNQQNAEAQCPCCTAARARERPAGCSSSRSCSQMHARRLGLDTRAHVLTGARDAWQWLDPGRSWHVSARERSFLVWCEETTRGWHVRLHRHSSDWRKELCFYRQQEKDASSLNSHVTSRLLQEYYIRHLGHSAGSSGEDRDCLCRALEDAIERRYTEVE